MITFEMDKRCCTLSDFEHLACGKSSTTKMTTGWKKSKMNKVATKESSDLFKYWNAERLQPPYKLPDL